MKLNLFWQCVQLATLIGISVSHIGWGLWFTVVCWQVLAVLVIHGLAALTRHPAP